MTPEELKHKVEKMFREINIQECVDAIIDSGKVDIHSWNNDYRLPKIVLSASLKHLAWQYEPVDAHDKEQVSQVKLHIT